MGIRQVTCPQTKKTLSIGRQWVLLAVVALSSACLLTQPQASPTPAPTATQQPARVVIRTSPAGAAVLVDGQPSGHTPLELTLAPSTHTIRVELAGYAPVERTMELAPGQALTLTETLRDTASPHVELAGVSASAMVGDTVSIRARATDNDQVVSMRLSTNGSFLFETRGAELDYAWNTGGETAGVCELRVEAIDADGNVGLAAQQVTLVRPATPTPAPSPAPSPTSTPPVCIYETRLSIPTYPYASFLHERLDADYNWRVLWLDHGAYEASRPVPQPRQYQAVVLENRYLQLVFLPELGGRLYQCIVKATGQNIFYQNPVIKPSYWGPLPRDENWWLAAGGMEWALPVQEHGYDWGVPWAYRTTTSREGATIILISSAGADQVAASITVTLPAESRSFRVQPRLTNRSSQPQALQFWINAALALGSTTVTPNTHFVIPANRATVHSSGDSTLPAEHQTMSWPVYDGRDLSRYGNWRNWLGVFFADAAANYVGAYSDETGLGVARVYPSDLAPGCKLFGFGTDFAARDEYADDGSQYFELWGGPCRSFWAEDDLLLAAGQSIAWSETWLPFTGLGGISYANAEAVAFTMLDGGAVRLSIAPARAGNSELSVSWNGKTLYTGQLVLDPNRPAALNLPLPSGASVPGELQIDLREGGLHLLTFTRTLGSQ